MCIVRCTYAICSPPLMLFLVYSKKDVMNEIMNTSSFILMLGRYLLASLGD